MSISSVSNLSKPSIKPAPVVDKNMDFGSVYKESMSNKEKTDQINTDKKDVKQVKETLEAQPVEKDIKEVQEPDGKEQLEEIADKIEELAEEEGMEPSEVVAAILAFLQTGDMEELTNFLMDKLSLESPMELVTNTDHYDLLLELKGLASELENLLLTDEGSLNLALIEESPMFNQFLEQEEAALTPVTEQVSEPTVEINTVQVEVTTDNQREDHQEGQASNEKGSQDHLLNNFASRMTSIEEVQDHMVDKVESKQLDQLLKQEIVQQVVNRISINVTGNNSEMTMQLRPEHLGKLVLNIVSNDGVLTAKFMTENQVVKEAIEANLYQLKETLEQQGINVDDIEVSVADNNFFDQREGNQQAFEQGRQNRRVNHGGMTELQEEVTEEEVISTGEHSVDYSA